MMGKKMSVGKKNSKEKKKTTQLKKKKAKKLNYIDQTVVKNKKGSL